MVAVAGRRRAGRRQTLWSLRCANGWVFMLLEGLRERRMPPYCICLYVHVCLRMSALVGEGVGRGVNLATVHSLAAACVPDSVDGCSTHEPIPGSFLMLPLFFV